MYLLLLSLFFVLTRCQNIISFEFDNITVLIQPYFNNVSILSSDLKIENQTIFFYVDFLKLNYPHGIYNNELVSQIIKFEKIISPCEGLDVSLLFSDQSELDIMIC